MNADNAPRHFIVPISRNRSVTDISIALEIPITVTSSEMMMIQTLRNLALTLSASSLASSSARSCWVSWVTRTAAGICRVAMFCVVATRSSALPATRAFHAVSGTVPSPINNTSALSAASPSRPAGRTVSPAITARPAASARAASSRECQ